MAPLLIELFLRHHESQRKLWFACSIDPNSCVKNGQVSSKYCGNDDGDDRDASIEALNKLKSKKFVFLLSTKAGGLGINVVTIDVIILDDSG